MNNFTTPILAISTPSIVNFVSFKYALYNLHTRRGCMYDQATNCCQQKLIKMPYLTSNKIIRTNVIVLLFISLCAINVLCESFFAGNVCYNQKWNGRIFLRDLLHKSFCEPYNATDLQEKQSLIFFEVN